MIPDAEEGCYFLASLFAIIGATRGYFFVNNSSNKSIARLSPD
jgi:hypothetical protein